MNEITARFEKNVTHNLEVEQNVFTLMVDGHPIGQPRHVLVSSSRAHGKVDETFVFVCNADGEPTNWSEITEASQPHAGMTGEAVEALLKFVNEGTTK